MLSVLSTFGMMSPMSSLSLDDEPQTRRARCSDGGDDEPAEHNELAEPAEHDEDAEPAEHAEDDELNQQVEQAEQAE
jgi:hypothetical protein